MSHTNTSVDDEGGDAGDSSLYMGLLITPTTTTTSSKNYKGLWRRSICVSVIIGLNRSTPSPSSYAPLPPTPTTTQRPLISRSSSQDEVKIDMPCDRVDQIVKERDLNALRVFGGIERVVTDFNSNLVTGLNINASPDPEPETWKTTNHEVQARVLFHFVWEECNSFTIFLLLVSAVLSLITESLQDGPKDGWHDGAIIVFAVFLLVSFPSVAKFRQARKLEKEIVMKERRPDIEVIRNGESQFVAISNILLGEVVWLKEGNRVPADGLYVDGGDGLVVDEVLNSNIDRDYNPFLFCGSKVIEGNGRMILTSVGTDTSIGKLMSMVKDDDLNEPTLLQTRIEKPNKYADRIALCMSILITLVVFLRFRKHDHDYNELPELKGKVRVEDVMMIFERVLLKPRGLVSILITSLTAVVLGFQHGMNLVITLALSYWNEKVLLSEHACSPQNLSACGTMGFATVICIDVSGGLLCSQMEVSKFLIGGREGKDSETSQIVREALQRGIGLSVLLPENLRTPTDGLLKSWMQSKWGDSSMDFSEENFAIAVGPRKKLSFNKKGSSTGVLMRKISDENNIMHLHWKGSAETIIGMCSHFYDNGGQSHALEDDQKSKFD